MKSLLLATTALVALTAAASADPIVLKAVPLSPTADMLSDGLKETAIAEGAYALENPSKYVGFYGYGS